MRGLLLFDFIFNQLVNNFLEMFQCLWLNSTHGFPKFLGWPVLSNPFKILCVAHTFTFNLIEANFSR